MEHRSVAAPLAWNTPVSARHHMRICRSNAMTISPILAPDAALRTDRAARGRWAGARGGRPWAGWHARRDGRAGHRQDRLGAHLGGGGRSARRTGWLRASLGAGRRPRVLAMVASAGRARARPRRAPRERL